MRNYFVFYVLAGVLQFCLIIMNLFEIKLLNVFKLVIMYKIMYNNKVEAESSKRQGFLLIFF